MRLGRRVKARLRNARLVGGICCLLALALLVPATATAGAPKDGELDATISRTTYGVPHIRADDIASLAFGFAYAFAEDNICTIADSYLTVSGERSRYLGPDATWTFAGNGVTLKNLNSDFFYTNLNESGVIERLIRTPPPNGPMPAVKRGVRGYVAGYNKYLRETGVDGIPDERCRGEEWVRPITEIDVYRRFFQLGGMASTGVAIPGIVAAAPLIGGASAAAARAAQADAIEDVSSGAMDSAFPLELGSNAYGLGSQATRTGSGMLLGNPHFPWDGAERLYQAHLTIPGEVDVAGGALYGVPLINIGHTDNLAWSHTVATAWRFTPYELTLAPGDPYSYVVDGEAVPMAENEVTVKTLADGGKLVNAQPHLLQHPLRADVQLAARASALPLDAAKAFALADVNATNFRYLNHFYLTNKAQSVREYDRIGRRVQGIPWVNSIAADSRGNAYYSMDGSIPNVSDAKATGCCGVLGAVTFTVLGLPTLDGSRSECGWDEDPGAASPGLLPVLADPAARPPRLRDQRKRQPLARQPRGPARGLPADRRHRGRPGDAADPARPDPGSGADRGHRRPARQTLLAQAAHPGRARQPPVRRRALARPTGQLLPLDAGAGRDGRADGDARRGLRRAGELGPPRQPRLQRRGAVPPLRHENVEPLAGAAQRDPGRDPPRRRPDLHDAVRSCRPGQHTERPEHGQPYVSAGLADAITDLREAGIPLDAPLRGYQYDVRGDKRIPIHGGPGGLGVFNAISAQWRPGEGGYTNIPHGSSFITAVAFTPGERCPAEARTFVTYGQSENQDSPHATDYPRAFSRKDWNEVPYCPWQIQSNPDLEVTRVSSASPTR